MDHYDDLLTDEHAPLLPVPSGEFNSVVRILDSQLVGVLQAHGTGVAEAGAWVVTAGAGLTVDVAAGAGIAVSGDDYLWLQTLSSENLELEANSTAYIYALAVWREEAEGPDSRESGVVEWYTNSTGGEVAGALPVALVTTGTSGISTITDLRTYIRGLQAVLEQAEETGDLDAIRAAIGAQYWGDDPPPTVDARLDDLEAAGAQGGTGPVYWGVLGKAAGVPTTIEQHVDTEIAAHVADLHGEAGVEFLAGLDWWDVDSANQGRHVLRQTRATDCDLPEHLLEMVAVVWGVYGDGTGTTPDYVDDVNSTWVGEEPFAGCQGWPYFLRSVSGEIELADFEVGEIVLVVVDHHDWPVDEGTDQLAEFVDCPLPTLSQLAGFVVRVTDATDGGQFGLEIEYVGDETVYEEDLETYEVLTGTGAGTLTWTREGLLEEA